MTLKKLDAMALFNAWQTLDSGASAQLRRVTKPDELQDIPAFYRLVQPFGWQEKDNQRQLLSMVFCLSSGKNVVKNTAEKVSLGRALAKTGAINERRVFQLIRADYPNDLVQLRRLLIHAQPTLNWDDFAQQLQYWGAKAKRQLLEDFVLATPKKD
ncbi:MULTISPECIES: type I-E CRISPR-associated protein Cse2/CasB [Marinomonas]|uniref:Type I-E CRISPR-associated protein Cse2/CasB n=1 Tax=Marinomonas rhodophyticola TaxID=2992803 RepID=A0ABT3KFF4_9GAMM|nr:type I-E CRISPR-associated protein Cse2/CasB [Marinomonas sp. KJ51-3]MCW4629271.1 type I-E CRISPR-associated protein Cse2/CasB [Marinomonas sp. KJ51-3]